MDCAPKVSVLIPTYNYAHFLDETIQSVLNQTFTEFELTIVDNCSTDNTTEVVQKYLADPRVTFYRNETNIGLVGNWNKCLEFARGEYIKFLNADDKFHPQILEKFVAIMEQHTDVAIVGCHDALFGLKNFRRASPYEGKVSGESVRADLLNARNKLRNPSLVMFRRADVEKTGKFNPQIFLQLLDREYYFRILGLGNCYVIPEVLCYTRIHPNTQTLNTSKKKYDLIFERYRFLKVAKAVTASQAGVLQAKVDAQLMQGAIRAAAAMYEVLPTLYKKKSRQVFKTALRIGSAEGVLLKPIRRYMKWEYVRKLLRK